MQNNFKKNNSTFWVLEQRDSENASFKLVGYFDVYPLTPNAKVKIEKGVINGTNLGPEHVVGANREAAAVYIGGLVAKGFTARGEILTKLAFVMGSFKFIADKEIFTRPTTRRGLTLAKRNGFRAADPAKKGLNAIYKQIFPATSTVSTPAEDVARGPKRDKIFVSYSHKDRRIFDEFKTMLAPAVRSGSIDPWDDTKIAPGARWKEEIKNALAAARIAVLLVSQNFLKSDFIAKHELPPLLQSAQERGVTIFWVCLSDCLYRMTEIADYQAAHDVSRPLSTLERPRRQAVLREICENLIEIADRR